jgi:actinin alpha
MAEKPGLADKGWEKMQIKTFTKWVNMHLAKKAQKIEDLFTGLTDGVQLANLLEILTDEPVSKKVRSPDKIKMTIHKQENIDICLKFIQSKGVKLLNIAANNIQEGHKMLTLGMIWQLILNLDVEEMSAEQMNARDALLLWCQKKTQGYNNVSVTNFTTSWTSGLAFCALIHKHKPGLINFNALDPAKDRENMETAFAAAESLGIARLLDVEDMCNGEKPDEKSVMTYLFQYYRYFAAGNKAETAARRIGKLVALTKQLDALRDSYNDKSGDWAAWTKAKTEELDRNRPGNSLEAVEQAYIPFQRFQYKEKPPRSQEKVELENLHSNIQLKLQNAKRPPFKAAHSPDDLNGLWNKLQHAEKECGANLKAELKRQKQLVDLVARFNRLCAKLEHFSKIKKDYLAQPTGVDSISAAQNKIKLHQGFTGDLHLQEPVEAEIQSLAKQIDALNYAEKASTNARAAKIASTFDELRTQGKARQELLEKELAHEQHKNQLRKDFATIAQAARAFYKQASLSLNASGFGNSLAAVEEAKKELDADTAAITKKADGQLATVFAKEGECKDAGIVDNEYTALSGADIQGDHNDLLDRLRQRDETYAQELAAMRELEEKRKEFAHAAQELQQLIHQQQGVMNSDHESDDHKIAAVNNTFQEGRDVQALLNKCQQLDADIKQRLKATENQHTKVSAADLERLVAGHHQQAKHHVSTAEESKANKARALAKDQEREARVKQQNESLDFAIAANALLNWASSVQDNVGQDLETLTSSAAVDQQRELFNQSNHQRGEQTAALQSLEEKSKAMAGSGNNDFGGVNLAEVQAAVQNALGQLDARGAALATADQKQASDSGLRNTFVAAAKDLDHYIKSTGAKVQEESKGELEDQLNNVLAIQQDRNTTGGGLLEKVDAANEAMNEAAISADEISDLNVETLSADFNALGDAIKSRAGAIQDAINAKNASQVPPERVAEFKQTFDHFDKNKNGVLSQLEFKGCLSAMGDEKSDEQMAELMKEVDPAGTGSCKFNEFMQYMLRVTQDQDSEDEILAAFRTITNDADVITEDQIRSVMGKDEADYLVGSLPKVAGGFDYKSWTGKAFGK